MDITRVVLDMIKVRVDNKFKEACEIVEALNKKQEAASSDAQDWAKDLSIKLAKEAEAKFEKEVLKRFPGSTFNNEGYYRTTAAFDVEYNYNLNVKVDKSKSEEYDKLLASVVETCKQIAIENGPKSAFREIDKYLDTLDPVKSLGL